MSDNKFGDNLEAFLIDISAADSDQIESHLIDIYGEDEHGVEGAVEIDIRELCGVAAATIATLTEQVRAQDKWISVDVRLPEAYETDGNYHASDEVLVLCAGKLEFALYQYGPDSGGWESWYCHFYEDNLENVTHWMPLPTPPKEAE